MFVSLPISVPPTPLLLSRVRYLAAGALRPAAALASYLFSDLSRRDAGVMEVYDRVMERFRFSAPLLFQLHFFPPVVHLLSLIKR